MCIICNCDRPGSEFGGDFLFAFEKARSEMRKAADAMLGCSRVADKAEARKQYNKTHKLIVRLIREWNRIEHKREVHHALQEEGW